MGYAGGSRPDPTYHDLGDHTEAFQLDFDSQIITYAELFAIAFAGFRAGRAPRSTQYMTAAFPANAEQLRIATERGVPAIPDARFYLAEDYHQKYYLRHDSVLMRELEGLTPQQFVDSTIAARLNGYVAGRGSVAQLREDLDSLRLSAEARRHLERVVAARM